MTCFPNSPNCGGSGVLLTYSEFYVNGTAGFGITGNITCFRCSDELYSVLKVCFQLEKVWRLLISSPVTSTIFIGKAI